MLKFAGRWDIHSTFRPRRRNPLGDKTGDFDIPTVDEVDAFNAASDAAIIRQILSNDIAAVSVYFSSDIEETRGRRNKPIPAQDFLPTPNREKPASKSNGSKKVRLDISARSHAERTMLEHWKTTERRWLAVNRVKLTSRQRIFFHACICGGYNRESALALARQFIPSKGQVIDG